MQNLLVLRINQGTDGSRLAQVHGRIVHRSNFTGGNQGFINRREEIRMELDVVIENVSSSRQIEIGMVGQIEDRRFVSHSTIIDGQLRTLQSVDDLDTECPGIVFLSIPTDIGQT